jgi:putative flippase GtrA
LKALLLQFLKYAISGVIATGVHLIVFYGMTTFLWPALTADDPALPFLAWLGARAAPAALTDAERAARALAANGVGFVLSNLTAYVLNILWVFTRGRHRWWVEIGLFYAVAGVSLIVGSALQTWLIARLGWSTTVAFGANVVVSLMINYVLRKFVIFRG